MKSRDELGRFTFSGETILKRGYPMLYLPTHKRAKKNGYVFEHIVVAEKMLGRSLTDSEVVHHIDEDKMNNNPDNLMIFTNNQEHVRFHWASRCEKYCYDDKMYTMMELAEFAGIGYERMYQRIKKLHWDINRAVEEV